MPQLKQQQYLQAWGLVHLATYNGEALGAGGPRQDASRPVRLDAQVAPFTAALDVALDRPSQSRRRLSRAQKEILQVAERLQSRVRDMVQAWEDWGDQVAPAGPLYLQDHLQILDMAEDSLRAAKVKKAALEEAYQAVDSYCTELHTTLARSRSGNLKSRPKRGKGSSRAS